MKATKVWFDDGKIFILTDSNEELWQSLLWYPRLLTATDAQRSDYRFSPFGIHWKSIDEDISFDSFTYPEREPQSSIARVLRSLPEINVSQFARRMGIPQSLLASYISGIKTPSKRRCKEIETAIHKLGQELMSVSL